ncbi:cytidylate kinase-like family protein [candidate division TA06 bacterium]|uniref:Cytidylate kinase-like family protein n=1 Tax=candidate division TA06 bacterium TaxID=2250710 RepID=A0A933MIT3_UNCT6|nr:cytidylate kinase-like family protein [candidate division TA06 bacterium]
MPVITISKQHGAGGKEIALALARGLSCEVVDKSLIIKVAQQARVGADRVESFDQEQYSPIDKYLSGIFLANPALYGPGSFDFPMTGSAGFTADQDFFNAQKYLTLTQALIKELYQKGNVLLVGRGSQVLLSDQPGCLHLRLCAPLEYRIKRVMEKAGVSQKEAREKIAARDKSRASYIKDYYQRDWNDPGLYHLTINTQRVAPEIIAALVKQMLNSKS